MASTRSSTPSMNSNPPRNWEDLAKRAAEEADPNKLTQIIKELCEAFDQCDQIASKVRVCK